ncbi:MAG: hypothetical protein WCL48_06740 [Betaproteobacteria bacterium]
MSFLDERMPEPMVLEDARKRADASLRPKSTYAHQTPIEPWTPTAEP